MGKVNRTKVVSTAFVAVPVGMANSVVEFVDNVTDKTYTVEYNA